MTLTATQTAPSTLGRVDLGEVDRDDVALLIHALRVSELGNLRASTNREITTEEAIRRNRELDTLAAYLAYRVQFAGR